MQYGIKYLTWNNPAVRQHINIHEMKVPSCTMEYKHPAVGWNKSPYSWMEYKHPTAGWNKASNSWME